MLLMVHVRPEREKDLEAPEQLQCNPPVPYRTYIDSYGNRCTRLVAPAGLFQLSNHFRQIGAVNKFPLDLRKLLGKLHLFFLC